MILKFDGFCLLVANVKGMCDLALHCVCSLCSFFNYEDDTNPIFNHKRRKKIVMEGTKLDM
jgi:hypothetical protein